LFDRSFSTSEVNAMPSQDGALMSGCKDIKTLEVRN